MCKFHKFKERSKKKKTTEISCSEEKTTKNQKMKKKRSVQQMKYIDFDNKQNGQ